MVQTQALSLNALVPFVKNKVDQYQLDLYLKGIHCNHCVYKIQKALDESSSVSDYRMSAGGSQVSLFSKDLENFPKVIELIGNQGFEAVPVVATEIVEKEENDFKQSIKQLAVAGVCAGNIMLFSAANYLGAPENFK